VTDDNVTPPDAPDAAYGGPARLGIQYGEGQAPDGSWWITISIMLGAGSFTFGIPVDGADQIADTMRDEIRAHAKEARLKRSGIVVAGASATPGAFRHHGNGGRRRR
jgi:hypothetical protein